MGLQRGRERRVGGELPGGVRLGEPVVLEDVSRDLAEDLLSAFLLVVVGGVRVRVRVLFLEQEGWLALESGGENGERRRAGELR